MTKHYFAGSQRVAVRKGSVLNFTLSDHRPNPDVSATNHAMLVVWANMPIVWGYPRLLLMYLRHRRR
jgi:hypothetical protein